MVRVGLIGCGTIGSRLARIVASDYRRVARITALHDVNPVAARTLAQRLPSHPPIVSLSELIRRSDLVLEAASVDAAADVVERALRADRHVFIMSVGGLLQSHRWPRLLRHSKGRLSIPSGALAGVDGINALAVGRIRSATLTSRKPPRALASAPYVRRRHLQLDRLAQPKVIFEGPPAAAVAAFPQNANVAAALTLAVCRGKMRRRHLPPIRIRIVADPTVRMNVHEVEVVGDCGRIQSRVQSRPSENPKTSELAVRSAVATLGKLFESIQIGT